MWLKTFGKLTESQKKCLAKKNLCCHLQSRLSMALFHTQLMAKRTNMAKKDSIMLCLLTNIGFQGAKSWQQLWFLWSGPSLPSPFFSFFFLRWVVFIQAFYLVDFHKSHKSHKSLFDIMTFYELIKISSFGKGSCYTGATWWRWAQVIIVVNIISAWGKGWYKA